jgi:toxin ParE1/3/4
MAAQPRSTRLALRDLRRIVRYIEGESGRGRALEVVLRLRQACELLAENPLAGREVGHLVAGLRAFAVRPYLIFYRPERGRVVVVRVIHGARDVESALAQRD